VPKNQEFLSKIYRNSRLYLIMFASAMYSHLFLDTFQGGLTNPRRLLLILQCLFEILLGNNQKHHWLKVKLDHKEIFKFFLLRLNIRVFQQKVIPILLILFFHHFLLLFFVFQEILSNNLHIHYFLCLLMYIVAQITRRIISFLISNLKNFNF